MRASLPLVALVLALGLAPLPVFADEDAWTTDLDAALARARREKKSLVVDLSSPG